MNTFLLLLFGLNDTFFVNKESILMIILMKSFDKFSFKLFSLSINSTLITKYKYSIFINLDSNKRLK